MFETRISEKKKLSHEYREWYLDSSIEYVCIDSIYHEYLNFAKD